ncbi:GMC oxidoreductase [Devosia sp. Leaf64]|uniref:GMC oxidoreductase n=1 Tax=Devosia sp. Leaf64 TaxID=1736229 RepID=UPI00244E896E|nr:GMC oxidoreductase [Devosia sp. Leaf64]
MCIIGAGMAGLTLAHSLALKGIRVLLLESGDTVVDGEAEILNRIDNVNGRWTGALRSRCRGIGGTSRRWGGRTIPIALEEARARPHLDSEGWPFPISELDRYTAEIETLLLLDHSSYEADLYGQTDIDPDFRIRWAKWPAFSNLNLAKRLHRQVISNRHVTIWSNATVTGFAFAAADGRLDKVTARHCSGREITVRAQRFVIAAGAVESTRLLLWMQRQPGQGLLGSKALGRYFQDHLNLKSAKVVRHHVGESNKLLGYRFANSVRRSLHLELSPQTQAECGVASAFAYVSMDMDGSALGSIKKIARNLQQGQMDTTELLALSGHSSLIFQSLVWRYMRKRLLVPASVDFNVEICAEQAPHWDNAITLSKDKDRHGIPLASIDWEPKAEDEKTLRVSVERLAQFWSRSGWDKVASLAFLPSITDSCSRLVDTSIDYYHPSGTTRMGWDKASSTVSGDLTCHDVSNLSVLSASVFPRAGSANPTFTLMRMAHRLGDYLATKF